MNTFPALPGSFLINVDPDETPLPIVGWFHKGDRTGVLPLVVGRLGPLVAGDAILAESGRVLDLMTGTFYSDAETWREHVSRADLYRPGFTDPLLAFTEAKAPPATAFPKKPSAAPAPRPENALPPGPKTLAVAPSGLFSWSSKTYKSKSFWRFDLNGESFVFMLEGETMIPSGDGLTKITRDEFYAARKDGVEEKTVTPGDDQPDLPLADSDDDDTDGLI